MMYQFVMPVMMIFSLMRNGLFLNIWFYQGWLLIMLTGQLETGTITVDVGRGPEVKMTLPAIKILIRSTGRSRNWRRLVEHVKCGEIPVTKLIPVGVLDTKEPLVMRVSTITSELSEVETSAYSETDINDIPVIKECVSPERRRREQLSAYADTQLMMNNYRRGATDCCFGVCGMTDSLNRSEIGWCWDCVDRLLWGYRVSCLVTIIIKDRSYGIDLCTEERRVYTSGLGLVGVPMRPYDAISVYMMMNENFKGGLNNVMLRIKDLVDSRYPSGAWTINMRWRHAHQ